MTETGSDESWGWDLLHSRVVRWSERGPGDTVLGPYPSREAAEQWRERVEDRNSAWDEADERWSGDASHDHADGGD